MIVPNAKKSLPDTPEEQSSARNIPGSSQGEVPPPPYIPETVPSTSVVSLGAEHQPPPHNLPSHANSMPPPDQSTSTTLQSAGPQRVNQVNLFSKQNVITGNYLIDPELPALSRPKTSTRSYSESDTLRTVSKRTMREARKAFGEGERRLGGLLRGLPPVVNAVFRTHHGDINVDLAIVGMTLGSTKGRSRARVLVSSRYGHIRLNFSELQEARCVDIDVSSRRGNIIVLFPPTYSGEIVIRSQRGFSPSSFSLLPQFAAVASIVRSSDHESRLILSPAPDANGQLPTERSEETLDSTTISTRVGKVTLGLCGLDTVTIEAPSPGLFKKLGEYIQFQAKAIETSLKDTLDAIV